MINLFYENKANINYHDPYIKNFKFDFSGDKIQKSIDLLPQVISQYDLVVIATDHDNIDYKLIYNNAELILDTRGKYLSKDKKIIKCWTYN